MFDLYDALEWESIAPFGRVHWVSGIYKLTSYTHYKGRDVKRYWRAYMVMPRQENWGDSVPGLAAEPMPTLQYCKAACAKHCADYVPSNHQIKVAKRSADKLREDQ